jgi:hypothetical protein
VNDRNLKDLGAQVGKELKAQVTILGGFVAIIWIVQIINAVVFGGNLALIWDHSPSPDWVCGGFSWLRSCMVVLPMWRLIRCRF